MEEGANIFPTHATREGVETKDQNTLLATTPSCWASLLDIY